MAAASSMAHSCLTAGSGPRTRCTADHADPTGATVCTGALPERLGTCPLRADLRQPCAEHPRATLRRGRLIPYGGRAHYRLTGLPAPSSILPLMPGIVFSPVGRAPVAAIGSSPPRHARHLTAGARTEPIPTVAATAHREPQPATPTVTQVENRNLDRHRSLQCWRTGPPLPNRARLPLSVWCLGSVSAAPRNDTKTPAPTGVFTFTPALRVFPTRRHHPPRSARDDAAITFRLRAQIPTVRSARQHPRSRPRSPPRRAQPARGARAQPPRR